MATRQTHHCRQLHALSEVLQGCAVAGGGESGVGGGGEGGHEGGLVVTREAARDGTLDLLWLVVAPSRVAVVLSTYESKDSTRTLNTEYSESNILNSTALVKDPIKLTPYIKHSTVARHTLRQQWREP